MPEFRTQKETIVLQVLCILVNYVNSNSQTFEAMINMRPEPTVINYIQFGILDTHYKTIQDNFFNITTSSIRLKYAYPNGGQIAQIIEIDKQTNNDHTNNMFLYFRCSVKISTMTIECNRNVKCNIMGVNICPNGFGISWLNVDEYLVSGHLQNSTVSCSGGDKVECYKLIDITSSIKTETVTSPLTKSSSEVKTDTSTRAQQTTESTTQIVLTNSSLTSTVSLKNFLTKSTPSGSITITTIVTHSSPNNVNADYRTTAELKSTDKVISTPLYIMNNLTSTMHSIYYSTERTSSDSTAIIAGVTVSVVIIIIIFVIVILVFMKRKAKKKLTRNEDIQNPNQEMTDSSFSGLVYNGQVLNLDEHSESTDSNVTYNEHHVHYNGTITNNYTHTPGKGKTRDSISSSISDNEDYTGIEEEPNFSPPLSADKSNDDYNTIDDKRGILVSRLVARDVEVGKSSTEGHYSVVNQVHPVSIVAEYSPVNKNVGYKNFKEILRNKHLAAVNEYNNITEDNTTIGKTEPAKNVYSKLRENIRHFENTYGDLGESVQTGKNNSSLTQDNTYFILEAEQNSN